MRKIEFNLMCKYNKSTSNTYLNISRKTKFLKKKTLMLKL